MQDKTQFEKEWENAFADAEMDVSASVWEKVELGVSQSSTNKYKKRLLLFQLLAAASVVFAMTVGGVAVYHLQFNNLDADESEIAMTETTSEQRGHAGSKPQTFENPEINKAESTSPVEQSESGDNKGYIGSDHNKENTNKRLLNENFNNGSREVTGERLANANAGVATEKIGRGNDQLADKEAGSTMKMEDISDNNTQGAVTIAMAEHESVADEKNEEYGGTNLPGDGREKSLVASGGIHNNLNNANGNTLPEELDRLFEYLETAPVEERELNMVPWYSYVPTKKPNDGDGLWAGIGFSAGSFDPNMGGGSSNADMVMAETSKLNVASKRAPSFGKEKAGQAYNVGVNFGTRLSERWVLQSGIVYAQQQTTSTSNVVNTSDRESAKTLSNFADMADAEDIAFTAPYDVNNTYELVSVPIQAGYVLLDSKFNIVILSGVANNILLNNQVSASSGEIKDVNISAGADSQYRTYQLSGLLGSEFSYDFGSHYRLAIIPQVKQSINSITKSGSEYTSRPTTLEIGFRFKYVFNN
ncbi:hypothetical protein LVD17_19120 [Fulvivirga ulvae]|uniref:hypothetical protein n=1 Tax=Fulvivirga ulvae TaxID=2904245 RepID=UPI001F40A543|nr:hypothetical protein [Fulvivirga ulvae]UII30406.1 hypothetical protein LVD17_19120 [Fulvivirga ulvae]